MFSYPTNVCVTLPATSCQYIFASQLNAFSRSVHSPTFFLLLDLDCPKNSLSAQVLARYAFHNSSPRTSGIAWLNSGNWRKLTKTLLQLGVDS